jgi:3-oxoacyl-[acyl-carrier protein] reductase
MAKVILITGTRKGLGFDLAMDYLEQGCIVCGCSRGESSISHANYRHFVLDVTDEMAVVAMVRMVKKEFKRIDILLNNAGIASMNHILTTSYTTAKQVMATNFLGSFLFIREVGKIMMRQKKGRIVNYSTVAVAFNLAGEAIYAASKGAVETLTKTASNELAPLGITVNAVGPTPVATDLIKAVPGDKIQALLNRQAIQRFGRFEDVKNVINFFVDDRSDFVSGQVIYLGGVNN